jgi:hypothetical protein
LLSVAAHNFAVRIDTGPNTGPTAVCAMSHNPLHMANNVIPNRFIVLNFVASYCIVVNYGKQQNLLKK